MHHSHIARVFGIQFVSRGLIAAYLSDLLDNPSHPGPWTDIDNRHQLANKKPASVSGFKLMYNTLETYRGLQHWADGNPDLMILHMTRRNLLKSFILSRRMADNKIAHTKSSSLHYSPVNIETRQLESYFEKTLATRNRYHSIFGDRHPLLELSYEDMFSDRERFIERILTFFSLPVEEMEAPSMKKIGSSRLRDEVENPDEIIEFLSGTPYEQYLEEFEI